MELKYAIKHLIGIAEKINDVDTQSELLDEVSNIISELASTINCPSNWRSIGEELAEEYVDNRLVYESLKLWEYEEW